MTDAPSHQRSTVPRALSRKNLWEALPPSLRSMVGWATVLINPIRLLGREFRRVGHFVDGAQWWSAERAREYQLVELQRICSLAFEKSPYYRRMFSDVGFAPSDLKSVEDMNRLPTISKDVLRENLEEMCTMPANSQGIDYISTGGSGGVPLQFYIGAGRSAIEHAYLVAGWKRAGYQPEVPMAVMRGQIVPEDRRGLHHEYDPILRRHYYSSFHMSDENMSRYLAHIATIGPCFLLVYPSSATALARFVLRNGIVAPSNIRGIFAGSEIVYPEDRAVAESTLGGRFLSWYGHSEKLVMAVECEHSTDYHVWPTYGYFELLDEMGKSVTTPGMVGEIVGTGFINTIVPFIRYRTGDFATYVDRKCAACGREHILIRQVHGHRTQEMLVTADGSEVSWTALNVHDDAFAQVRQFQFYQDTPGRAVLRILPGTGFGDAAGERIRRSLGRKLEGRVQFDIQLVDSIPLSPRGKAIYVDQRIRPQCTA